MSGRKRAVRPEIRVLVEIGKGFGGTKVSSQDRAIILQNLRRALASSLKNR